MMPTGRTLDLLRKSGYLADVVERWLPRINRRRDLFGFADVLAVHRRLGFLLVQVTTAAHVPDRLEKARHRPELEVWLAAGGRFEVHGWALRSGRWLCRVVEVTGADLVPMETIPLPVRRRGRAWKQRGLFELRTLTPQEKVHP